MCFFLLYGESEKVTHSGDSKTLNALYILSPHANDVRYCLRVSHGVVRNGCRATTERRSGRLRSFSLPVELGSTCIYCVQKCVIRTKAINLRSAFTGRQVCGWHCIGSIGKSFVESESWYREGVWNDLIVILKGGCSTMTNTWVIHRTGSQNPIDSTIDMTGRFFAPKHRS